MSRPSSASRAGGASGPGSSNVSMTIPASSRKVVQDLKEILEYTEEEIYATLKECNMDPNETVERLMHQDPFEEVKRKRDKRKEGTPNRESVDQRRPSHAGSRGGRGSSAPDRTSSRSGGPRYDSGGGRGRTRENGVHPGRGTAAPAPASTPISSTPPSSGGSAVATAPPSGLQTGFLPPSSLPVQAANSVPSGTGGMSSDFTNRSLYSRVAPGPSSWGSGATMADIVKASGAPTALQHMPAASNPSPSLPPTSLPQPYSPSSPLASPPATLGLYSSSDDPVLHPALDPRASGPAGGVPKRDVGTVGNQRPIGERPVSGSHQLDSSAHASPLRPSEPSQQAGLSAANLSMTAGSPVDSISLDERAQVPIQVQVPQTQAQQLPQVPLAGPSIVAASASQDMSSGQSGMVDPSLGLPAKGTSTGSRPGSAAPSASLVSSSSRVATMTNSYNGRPAAYQPQQQSLGPPSNDLPSTAQGTSEWQPKSAGGMASTLPNVSSPEDSGEEPQVESSSASAALSNKMQSLNVISAEEKSVIIPGHLQVADVDQTRLSFGSFGSFGSSFGSGFGPEEVRSSAPPAPMTSAETSAETAGEPTGPISSTGMTASVPPSSAYMQQPVATAGIAVSSDAVMANAQHLQTGTKVEMMVPQPAPAYTAASYGPAIPQTYAFGLMPQYTTYETADAPSAEVSRLAGIGLQPYADPASFYSPAFRPSNGVDAESRYSALPALSSSAASKYSASPASTAAPHQGLPAHDVQGLGGGAVAGQMAHNQGGGLNPSVTSVGQQQQSAQQQPQPMALHAFPQQAAIPLGYGALNYGAYLNQYMPPNYAYTMHTAYPGPGYAPAPANNAYPQAPPASSYPQLGGGKLPIPGQYKAASAAGAAPYSGAAGGYGGYAAPSGYGGGPGGSGAATSGYEDAGGQYKDSSLYIPSQQLARELPGSSYYNLNLGGQSGAYTPSQQQQGGPGHPVTAYGGGLYPSGPAGPTGHQLLQPGQGVGSSGSSVQAASYPQQPQQQQGVQRTQQSWNTTY